MYHPGGYGGLSKSDCVIVPDCSHALAFAFRGDNTGPPNVTEVISVYSQLRGEFPDARIVASTLDNFVSELEKVKNELPIVTTEFGDSWIYGVASDPKKLAQYREIARLREECLRDMECDENNESFKNFTRFLLKISEVSTCLWLVICVNDRCC